MRALGLWAFSFSLIQIGVHQKDKELVFWCLLSIVMFFLMENLPMEYCRYKNCCKAINHGGAHVDFDGNEIGDEA